MTFPRNTRFLKVYQSADRRDKGAKRFRWNLRYRHNILSDSGQSYADRSSAKHAALTNGVPVGDFPVVVEYEKRVGKQLVWVQDRVR